MSYAIAVVLIGLGALVRLLPHPHGAVAIGALAIFAGARLPRFAALCVPIGALVISDIINVFGTQYAYTIYEPASLLRYAIVAGIALSSSFLPRNLGLGYRCLQGIGAAVAFFLASNFLVWAFPYGNPGDPGYYAHTWAGLMECYAWGLEFFRNSLVAEVGGVAVLFGLDAAAQAYGKRLLSSESRSATV